LEWNCFQHDLGWRYKQRREVKTAHCHLENPLNGSLLKISGGMSTPKSQFQFGMMARQNQTSKTVLAS